MPKGTVLEFTEQAGFGKMQLDTGDVVNFDCVVCDTMDIEVGDVADVEIKELAGRMVVRRAMFNKGD